MNHYGDLIILSEYQLARLTMELTRLSSDAKALIVIVLILLTNTYPSEQNKQKPLMLLKDKVLDKEKSIRQLLDNLRNHLNNQRLEYNQNPNNWIYPTSLSHTELKLKELNDYFETIPK